jgi:hypothetical protein
MAEHMTLVKAIRSMLVKLALATIVEFKVPASCEKYANA